MSKLSIASASKIFAFQMYFSIDPCLRLVYCARYKLECIVIILGISSTKIEISARYTNEVLPIRILWKRNAEFHIIEHVAI